MIDVLLDVLEIENLLWVAEIHTINERYYLDILRQLHERIKGKWPELKMFVAKYNVSELDHPTY